MSEEFKNQLKYVKSRWPNLEEEPVKAWIRFNIESQNQVKIEKTIARLRSVLIKYPEIYRELLWIEEAITVLRESCVKDEVDQFYLTLKKGSFHKEQVYHRNFHPMGRMDFFTLRWSVAKANQIIKDEKISKENFAINKMNIDESQLEKAHIKNTLKNKNPGILISYEAFKGGPYYHILIDGNHRVTANQLYRNKNDYSVYKLDPLQTLKSLQHPYYMAFYLLHFLLTLFPSPDELKEEELANRLEQYRGLKNGAFDLRDLENIFI